MLVDYTLLDLKNSLEVLDLDVGRLFAHLFALELAIVNIADADA